ELMAFLGLLLQAGVEKSWDRPTDELFNCVESNPIYRAVMSRDRFKNILRYIRFDDKRTRPHRLETDKIAAIRYIWELFLTNARSMFVPGDCVTIDEQLVGFRGRCAFIQYMPSKPAKYGIKFFWLCDAKTGYAFNGCIYIGKQPGASVEKDLAANT